MKKTIDSWSTVDLYTDVYCTPHIPHMHTHVRAHTHKISEKAQVDIRMLNEI